MLLGGAQASEVMWCAKETFDLRSESELHAWACVSGGEDLKPACISQSQCSVTNVGRADFPVTSGSSSRSYLTA